MRPGKAAPFLWVEGPPGELAPAGSNRSSHEFVATNFGRRPLALIEEVRFASDSSLEGDGFELSVPRQRRRPSATANRLSRHHFREISACASHQRLRPLRGNPPSFPGKSANFGVSDRRFRFKPACGFGGNRQAVSVQSGTPLRMGFGPDFGEPPLRDTSYLALVCQSKYSCHYYSF